VLHVDRQLGVAAAQRTHGDMTAHPYSQIAVELAVHERIEIATVAEMSERHHGGGNPTPTEILPGE